MLIDWHILFVHVKLICLFVYLSIFLGWVGDFWSSNKPKYDDLINSLSLFRINYYFRFLFTSVISFHCLKQISNHVFFWYWLRNISLIINFRFCHEFPQFGEIIKKSSRNDPISWGQQCLTFLRLQLLLSFYNNKLGLVRLG